MPAKKQQGWLDRNWPFRHTEVQLNTNTNIIKIVAMVTMLIDHMGAALVPQDYVLAIGGISIPLYLVMRIVGRIAFPIYAYSIAVGCVYTRDMGRYLQRIAVLALIAQPIYALALHHTNNLMYLYSFSEEPLRAAWQFYLYSWMKPSILLSLAIGIGVIWSVRERKLFVTAFILLLCYLMKARYDYGINGTLLMLLLYLFLNRWYVSLPLVAAFMVYWGLGGARSLFGVNYNLQLFAVLSLPFIYIPMRPGFKMNKWVFYAFYPAHLLLLIVIEKWPEISAALF